MLKIQYRNTFEKDIKRSKKRGLDLSKLKEMMQMLAEEKLLPIKCRDHGLSGNYAGHRECHIQPDWLLTKLRLFETTLPKKTSPD